MLMKKELIENNKILQKENKELKERIDKAIEYMGANYINAKCNGLTWLEARTLLKILKGEDK